MKIEAESQRILRTMKNENQAFSGRNIVNINIIVNFLEETLSSSISCRVTIMAM